MTDVVWSQQCDVRRGVTIMQFECHDAYADDNHGLPVHAVRLSHH